MKDVLIIGGSAEARALAFALPGAAVLLPQGERVVGRWPGAVSRGPLTAERLAGVRAVIEAAHPCDDETAFAVARACTAAGVPNLQLVRPAWRAGARDRWVPVRSVAGARRVIPVGARVLVTTGRDLLPGLRGIRAHCLVRRIGAGPERFPLSFGRYLCDEGPFSVAHEIGLLRRERVDWLLMRNAGGPGGWPKLAAARSLGVPVAMVDRPTRPGGPRVTTVEEALAWLERV
ncbi:precorrin-6A/cobalt-precorrin-6A reductase [Tropicibacter sp. S64]|uniref:precorrin-6A/cobalt-precorrin-6A reductase n=1 Tax=Tropicibacter sp. S64 TaxID=3415122 RepID=UPI003C7D28A9